MDWWVWLLIGMCGGVPIGALIGAFLMVGEAGPDAGTPPRMF